MCQVFSPIGRLVPPVALLLIFTPQAHPSGMPPRNGRTAAHVHHGTHEPGLDVWAALIAFTDCPDVVLVDRFAFLADRPLFARQLFVRATAAGHRLSVRRHLGALEQLPAATHRLAIIVPIVINPSRVSTDELERFFGQLADQSNYVEFFRWLFVFEPTVTATVLGALRNAPIRPDSHVYCVSIAGDGDPPFGHRVHLERKMMLPTGRFVPRMQMVPHPEAKPARTVAVSLRLESSNGASNVSVWQLYRLHTRGTTIDVAVELVETNAAGEMLLHRPRSLEQRNDFFDQAHLTIVVYDSVAKHIDPMYVAQSMPLFRNARTTVEPYKVGNSLNRVDFHFQLVITSHFNKRLQGWIVYSLPVFHEHLNLYIRYADIGYQERSYRILLIILLPVALMGILLCVSLHVALHVTNARKGGEPTHPSLTPLDSFLWLVGIIAQQGSSVRPTSTSSMIVILAALSFSAIVYCTYLAKITAQLSVDVEVDGNLLALLAEEQYRIGFVGNFTSEQTFLGHRYDPAMHEVMRRMQHDKSLYVFSYEEGLQRVLTSKYALIGDAGTVRMAMQEFGVTENCIITEINLDGIEQMVALQMAATYAYRKMINYQILRYYSNGLIFRVREAIIPRRKKCSTKKQFNRISISHLAMQHSLLIMGAVLAAIVLVVEVSYHWLKNVIKRDSRGNMFSGK